MGTAKAALEWHGSTLLHRTSAVLRRTVGGPVVVVASPGQELPALPSGVEVVEDPVEGLGPMQGIAVGLAAVADRASAAFVSSTDMPFLHPAFVRRVLRGLEAPGTDVALPFARGFRQPLAAGYRPGLSELIAKLVAEGQLRLGMLFQHCTVARIDDAQLLDDADLRRFDPDLDSLVNVNEPDDYAAARAREPAEIAVTCLATSERTVRAATLGAAAAAVGLDLDRHAVAVLNGTQIAYDEQLPLVAGDTVAFLARD